MQNDLSNGTRDGSERNFCMLRQAPIRIGSQQTLFPYFDKEAK